MPPRRSTERRQYGIGAARRPAVVEMRLAGRGVSEIAAALNVGPGVVTDTLARPDVRAAIEEGNRQSYGLIADRRGTLAVEALAVLASLMRGGDTPDDYEAVPASVRRQAASDLLDRCGVTKETAIRVSAEVSGSIGVALVDLTPEQLRALAWGDEPLVIDLPETPEAK